MPSSNECGQSIRKDTALETLDRFPLPTEIIAIARETRSKFLQFGELAKPEITDHELAKAMDATATARQRGPGLFSKTVPEYLRNGGVSASGSPTVTQILQWRSDE